MNKLLITMMLLSSTIFAETNSIQQELENKKAEAMEPVQQRSLDPGAIILASVAYNVDTTGGPTFGRPRSDGDGTSGSCVISGTGSNVNYATQNIFVDTDGLYTITADHTFGGSTFDGYLLLYEASFVPGDACLNLIGRDDDFDPGTGNTVDGSQILDIALSAGTTYIVVHTAFASGDVGQSSVDITGVGQPSLPVELQSFSID